MKKSALILLFSIYSLSIFGVGIKQFYCCGKLNSTTISFVQDSKEKCGKDKEMRGCCSTKFTSLKVEDSHLAADDTNNPAKFLKELHLFTPSFEGFALANQPMTVTNASHAPPLKQDIPIYILVCTYRI